MRMRDIFRSVATALSVVVTAVATAAAQTTAPADAELDFGAEGWVIPPATAVNAHAERTATLLGEAYRRRDPIEWKRVQYVADLGAVALPAAAPYLVDAMTDHAAPVRAEAARAASAIPAAPASLCAAVEKLLNDPNADVRRAAVLSAAALARARDASTTAAIERGIADAEPQVIAAALESAWTPAHAQLIAQKLPTLSKALQPDAALALGRMKVSAHARAVLALLAGDVVQRAAATHALGDLGDSRHLDATLTMLADVHPTVRREAAIATAKLADARTRQGRALSMLNDPDPTVRQVAVGLLQPVPSADAVAALAAQLGTDYAPLHDAARQAMSRPAVAPVRDATIRLAAEMLAHAEPRRRQDGSYVLGRLRSGEAIERHIRLLQWDPAAMDKADWALVGQAAESLGLIGDSRAAEPLMALVKSAPHSLANVAPERQQPIGEAMGNALVALGRIGHRPALDEAVRVLKLDPLGGVPAPLRAAGSFVVGTLGEPGTVPAGVEFLDMYGSSNETRQTKVEALKALGNLRYAPAANALKRISETEMSPELRWVAHWAYQRAANTTVPYTPPSLRREAPVTISDLPQ
jgi:HEAT repeat protein